MKKQIKRLSPHQNAKVLAVLMALSSLLFILPMFAAMSFTLPPSGSMGHIPEFPRVIVLLMPLFYFFTTYIAVVIGCIVYNFIAQYIGGFEFVVEDIES